MKIKNILKNNTLGYFQSVIWVFLLFASLSVTACGGDDDTQNPEPQPPVGPTSKVKPLMDALWQTSSLTSDKVQRSDYYRNIQSWADDCPTDNVFLKYLVADNVTASALEKTYPALEAYDYAFERVLNELKNGLPSGAEPRIWSLYNMGVVVQTSNGNYAIDIYHRRAAELAPYIDFYAITHIHADHKSEDLAKAMSALNRPVLTNFAIDGVNNSNYLSTTQKDYTIGSFNIHSFITHHNGSDLSKLAITAFYIDGGGVKVLHSGDSNFIADEFESMRNRQVDFYVFRYAVNALTENNVLGNIVHPKFAVLSHILELGHKDIANSRWSLDLGLDRAARLNCDKVSMPFWGDYIAL